MKGPQAIAERLAVPAPPSSGVPADVQAAIETLVRYARLDTTGENPWSKYPPVLRVKHVAELLGISENAVQSRCQRQGRPDSIPMVKRDGKWVVDQVEFRRWVGYGSLAAAAAGGGA